MNDKPNEYLFKVIVVGDMGVGKTSLIKRYVHNIFSMNYKTTIGVDFALKTINIDKDTDVRMQLWDISGQERFSNMTRVYYRDAVGAIIVFDLTRFATFETVDKWKKDINNKLQLDDQTDFPCLLLGNKCDLPNKIVSRDQIDKYMENEHYVDYFEVSAKDNQNVDNAMQKLVIQLINNNKDKKLELEETIIELEEPTVEQPTNKCC